MVMIYHLGFAGFWEDDGHFLATTFHSTVIGDFCRHFSYFGWVGVQLFFVISGFVIAYSAEGISAFSFFRSRFVRLMPALWICSTFAIPAAFVERADTATIVKLYARSLILYPHAPWIDGVIWTLPIEVSFYAIVFVLILKGWFKHIHVVASIIGGYSSAYWLLYGYSLSSSNLSFLSAKLSGLGWAYSMQLTLVHHGCFFALGVFLWLLLVKRQYGFYLFLVPVVLLGGCFEIICENGTKQVAAHIPQPASVPTVIWLVCLALVVLSIIYSAELFQRLGRFAAQVRWLGLLTYPLYLLHRPVAYVVMYLLTVAHVGQYAAWFSGVVAALAMAAFVTSYAEPRAKAATKNALNKAHNAVSRLAFYRVPLFR